MRQVLVIGDGERLDARVLSEFAATSERVIAADGGYDAACDAQIRPDLLIGDLDSLPKGLRERAVREGIAIEQHPTDKDQTDLELAIDRALQWSPERILLVGVLGGPRSDHALAALLLLERSFRHGVRATIVGNGEHIDLIARCWSPEQPEIGDLVSLLPLSETVRGIRTTGLEYMLHGEELERSRTRGLSNRIVALPVEICIDEGLMFVVHRMCGREGEATIPAA